MSESNPNAVADWAKDNGVATEPAATVLPPPVAKRLDELVARAEVTPKRRRPSKPTLGSKMRRLSEKAQRSSSKKMRGAPRDE